MLRRPDRGRGGLEGDCDVTVIVPVKVVAAATGPVWLVDCGAVGHSPNE
jgi:hypothetical protein